MLEKFSTSFGEKRKVAQAIGWVRRSRQAEAPSSSHRVKPGSHWPCREGLESDAWVTDFPATTRRSKPHRRSRSAGTRRGSPTLFAAAEPSGIQLSENPKCGLFGLGKSHLWQRISWSCPTHEVDFLTPKCATPWPCGQPINQGRTT